jgi:hypothetical protein
VVGGFVAWAAAWLAVANAAGLVVAAEDTGVAVLFKGRLQDVSPRVRMASRLSVNGLVKAGLIFMASSPWLQTSVYHLTKEGYNAGIPRRVKFYNIFTPVG